MKLKPMRAGPIVVESRYNGPPTSGNGGYSAGLVATHAPWDVPEVTLRRPPPLNTELTVRTGRDDAGNEVVRVSDPDGALVAEARSGAVEDPVEPVGFAEAVEASRGYAGFGEHPFPTCYVCGPRRPAGDGLRIFPGRLPGHRTAAPFLVPEDVTGPMVWAALDCPGGWAVPLEGRPYVLGRTTVRVDALPEPGQECVVMGQMTGEDGRKAFARTTLYSPAGEAIAVSRSVWVAL